MPEDFDFNQAESSMKDVIYGNDDEISEAFNSCLVAAEAFGPIVLATMVKTIDAAVPLMAEMNAQHPVDRDDWERLRVQYFGTDELAAKTVDAMAEGIKVAQRFLHEFLEGHGLDQITLYIPSLDRRGVRKWTFGRMSTLLSQGAFDGPVHLAGTVGIGEDQPRSTPSPKVEDHRNDQGYL